MKGERARVKRELGRCVERLEGVVLGARRGTKR